MTKPLNLQDHFMPIPGDPDGAMQLSMPALLLVTSSCIKSDDTPLQGKQRATSVLVEFVAMLRQIHYPRSST
jgi:hypothetical protein